jgi:hypothetical protein
MSFLLSTALKCVGGCPWALTRLGRGGTGPVAVCCLPPGSLQTNPEAVPDFRGLSAGNSARRALSRPATPEMDGGNGSDSIHPQAGGQPQWREHLCPGHLQRSHSTSRPLSTGPVDDSNAEALTKAPVNPAFSKLTCKLNHHQLHHQWSRQSHHTPSLETDVFDARRRR